MNKKILGIFVTVIALAMFAVPVMAEQTGTEVTYYPYYPMGSMTYPKILFCGESGNTLIKSYVEGVIYADEEMTTPLFEYVQEGKVTTNGKTWNQVWHFRHVWTKIDDPDSGFKGSLNGKGVYFGPGVFPPSDFAVSGVLNGFGECKGQKILLEFSWSQGMTGILVTK